MFWWYIHSSSYLKRSLFEFPSIFLNCKTKLTFITENGKITNTIIIWLPFFFFKYNIIYYYTELCISHRIVFSTQWFIVAFSYSKIIRIYMLSSPSPEGRVYRKDDRPTLPALYSIFLDFDHIIFCDRFCTWPFRMLIFFSNFSSNTFIYFYLLHTISS